MGIYFLFLKPFYFFFFLLFSVFLLSVGSAVSVYLLAG